MPRLLVAALVSLSAFGSAQAQSSTPTTTKPSPALDPKIREEIDREVAKAKAELEDQMRAEAQTSQAATQFVGPQEDEKPRLQFFDVHGYFRMRGDLFDHLDLNRNADPAGYFVYPRPLVDTLHRGTLTTGNLRLRLEPTLNASEYVRIKTQMDVLDNLVLGSTPGGLSQNVNNQLVPEAGANSTRSSIVVKRAYAEVQTPIGLLSFGRMPSEWGLGILSNAGNGTDSDYGDTVDRLQFAIDVRSTPVGDLTIIPMITWISTGVISQDPSQLSTIGQPFDRDQSDDAKAIGFQIQRLDSPERLKNRLKADLSSFNYGLWYSYRSQTYDISGDYKTDPSSETNSATVTRRDAYAHVVDVWSRYQTKRLRLELELTGVYGQIGNAGTTGSVLGPVLLRQFGGALQGSYQVVADKLSLGGEVGFASGDTNPGFGNDPGRSCPTSVYLANKCAGVIEGQQFHAGDKVLDIRNFNFNRAYRVDMVLWREILGGVTDAFYLKPTGHWNIVGGLALDAAIIYSQAIYASSTPSYNGPGTGHSPLGIEFDLGLSYTEDRFGAFLNYGLLQPLDGFSDPRADSASLSRGHALRSGLVVKF